MPVTICLNMIVKNESKIITRLFDTILPIIDTYCICDTGSTDNTREIIEHYFKEKKIPGKVIQEPFKDFGHNRTVALKAAKNMGTYLLFLDADMKLEISSDFDKQKLTAGAYLIRQGGGDFKYFNVRLLRTDVDATCVSPTHEYYKLPDSCSQERLFSLFINDVGDGGCKEDKFKRDVRLLLKGIEDEPKNGRYYFYLANSYFNIGQNEEALKYYKKRIEIGGWFEEIYYSYYRLGLTYVRLGEGEKAVNAWLEGHNHYPKRAECMYQLVNYYRERGKNTIAYNFYKIGTCIPYPKDNVLFIHENLYHTLFDYELSILAFYLIRDKLYRVEDIYGMYRTLLNTTPDVLNQNYYNNAISNYKFYTMKICALAEKIVEISNTLNNEFISSTPSIILHKDKWIMNLRYVNYRINDKGDYVNKEQITTFNEYCTLDDDFNVRTRKMIEEKEVPTRYRGVEDVRIFSHGDKILYSGVIQNTDKTNDVEITVSINDYNKEELVQKNLISPENRNVEKNWVLFNHTDDCKIIYQWYPLTIGHIDNDGKYIKDQLIQTPYMFHKFRGSTNGVVINDEIWFMCHYVSYEDRRFYYHCVVRLNKYTLEVVDYSKLFTFSGSPIEYCLGMVHKNNKLVFSYSIMDKTSYIMRIDREVFLKVLF